MKTKNNFKRVEKTYSYRLAKVTLIVVQIQPERRASIQLRADYDVAFTDEDSLSKFVLSVKNDPTKYFKQHFCFGTPIESKVMVDHIDNDFYSIGRESYKKQIIVVDSFIRFNFRDALQHNRNLICYKSEI